MLGAIWKFPTGEHGAISLAALSLQNGVLGAIDQSPKPNPKPNPEPNPNQHRVFYGIGATWAGFSQNTVNFDKVDMYLYTFPV